MLDSLGMHRYTKGLCVGDDELLAGVFSLCEQHFKGRRVSSMLLNADNGASSHSSDELQEYTAYTQDP